MSCIEACGILLWQQLQILLCFQMLLCLLLLISNLHRRQQFSLAKLLAKINLEVLQVSVSSCTQNLVQEAEKWKKFFLKMAFFMWPGLLWQCSSSCENHPKFWGFLVMVRKWRRVFCYVPWDTACLRCCRPLGCLLKNESMSQVIPKLKDGQKIQSNVTWLYQVGAV